MKLPFFLVGMLGCLIATAQTTTIPGLGRYQPEPVTPAPTPVQSAPVATPTSSRGIDVVPSDEAETATKSSVVRIGKPETMDLLDDTKPIKLGDKLEYMVAEDRDPPIVLFVAEDGQVDVPLIGKMPAVQKTSRQLAKELSSKLEEEYYYQATVHIAEARGARTRGEVFVMGQVMQQGMVPIPQNEVMTISRAILSAGGFAAMADPTRVTVIRKDDQNPEAEKRLEVNVNEILVDGNLKKDLVLQPNDLVFVAPRGDTSGTYTITGAIRAPGSFAIAANQQLYLSQAILQAGGLTEFGDPKDVKLIRYDEANKRIEKTVNVAKVFEQGIRDEDVLIQPGDQIIVGEKWISF